MCVVTLSACHDAEKQAEAERMAATKQAKEAANAVQRELEIHVPLSNEVDEFNYQIILLDRYLAEELKAYDLEPYDSLRWSFKINADDTQKALDEAHAVAPIVVALEAAGRHEDAVRKVHGAYQFGQFVVKLKEGHVYK